MVKLDRPTNLIGYFTEENIASGNKFKFSTRQKAYLVAMTLISFFMAFLLFMRNDVEATILRNAGFTYNVEKDGTVTNMYKINIVNKSNDDIDFSIKTNYENAILKIVGNNENKMVIRKGELYNGMMLVTIPPNNLNGLQNPIYFKIIGKDGKELDESKSSFLGPQQ